MNRVAKAMILTGAAALGLYVQAPAGAAAPSVRPTTPAPAAQLEVGADKVDITPTDLADLNPFGGGAFTAVHDPIFARALFLRSGTEMSAIVTLDVPEVGDMRAFLGRIERETGIPAGHVMLAATHDHSAPRVGEVTPGATAQKAGPASLRYSEQVYDRVIAALKQARAAARPARFGVANGAVDVNVSRDAYTPGQPGQMGQAGRPGGWGLGFNPDGPSDKTVRVARFESLDGKPIAVLFNYAVHSTVSFGIKEVSGDLAGAAERHAEDLLGDGAVAMFTMGAAGDQAPRVFRERQSGANPRDKALAYQAIEAQGVMLGTEVARVAATVQRTEGMVRMRSARAERSCPTKVAAPGPVAAVAGSAVMSSMSTATAPTVPIQLGLLQLNDVAFTGVGGEVVTNIHRRFERETPLANSFFMTIVNDRIGYIADDAAYDRPIFEVKASPFSRGCAEDAIVDGLVSLITQQDR